MGTASEHLLPAPHSNIAFRFCAIGDFCDFTGPSERASVDKLAQGMALYADTHPIDFVLGLGDNFYPEGVRSVNDREFQDWYAVFIKTHRSLQVPWHMVMGNHDMYQLYYSPGSNAQVDFTTHPNNHDRYWSMPDRNYSFSHKGVDFFALDSNGVSGSVASMIPTEPATTRANIKALADKLEKSRVGLKIVFAHHPMYTKGVGHGRSGDLLRLREFYPSWSPEVNRAYNLEETLIQGDCKIYIAGHEHVSQHHTIKGILNLVAGEKTVAAL